MTSSIKRTAKWLLPLYLSFFTFISCQKENNLNDEPIKTASLNLSDQETKYNTFKGPEVVVGNGYVRTFITRSHTGVPQELGVVFTNEALSGLAATNTPYILDFHSKALESTLFQHVALGWSANGHPLPGGAFIASHFDVRFFMMSLADRLAIPAPPAPALYVIPPTGYMPANYFSDVPGPQVGMHWTDQSFVANVPVNHAMILGSYNGRFTFVSPIVTRTELVNGTSISLPWTQPLLFADHGYYPGRYNIYKDDKNQHYVTLSDFEWR
ncbi:MAG: hypothetical protein ABIW38_00755 [Ferruginibacter sp.]